MTAVCAETEERLASLDQRLSQAAVVLLDIAADAEPARAPGALAVELLPRLLHVALASDESAPLWLVLTAVTGRFPEAGTVRRLRREARFASPEAVEKRVLDLALEPGKGSRLDLPMRIVTHVVIDVDTSARSDYQSGIHRVVRETVRRWDAEHSVELAVWDDGYAIFRAATPVERARVTQFGNHSGVSETAQPVELLVPWNTVVVVPDVPIGQSALSLTGLALDSGNRLCAVGYDLIPITSAETRPLHDSMAAGEWLVPLKAAHRIAGISTSATAEFRGFAAMLEAQGLPGPTVREVNLPASTAPSWFEAPSRVAHDVPRIVFSGTREPHKNHPALLYAAERLWAEGLEFEVRMVGGNGWTDAHVGATIGRLKAEGRRIVDLGRVSEERLWTELATADAVAFASLHEGYGLPVVEALAVGTPVLTTSYGSQGEIAEDGGCLTADPRDDESLVAALRRLVTEPDLRAELSRSARLRPERTWDDYAGELWDFLVSPDEQKVSR